MPNFSKLFQDEVRRLARKEAKDDIARIKKDNAELKRIVANARKDVTALQQTIKQLAKQVSKAGVAVSVPVAKAEAPAKRAPIPHGTGTLGYALARNFIGQEFIRRRGGRVAPGLRNSRTAHPFRYRRRPAGSHRHTRRYRS